MFIYKVRDTGNYYLSYEKAVAALRSYIGTVKKDSDTITHDNLDGYYDEGGNIRSPKTVDNIPNITVTNGADDYMFFSIMRVNVRE